MIRPSQSEPPPEGTSVQGPLVLSASQVFRSKPVLASVVALTALTCLQFLPGIDGLRPVARPASATPAATARAPATTLRRVGQTTLTEETESRPELEQPEHAVLPAVARGPIADRGNERFELPDVEAKVPPIPLDPGSGRALRSFFEALRRTQQGQSGAITRIAHFGDSIVVSDYVSGTLRRRFQDQFGDSGHGFVLLAGAWPAYHHNDVYRWASRGWKVSRIVGPTAADGLYGLGGVSFTAPPGARARFGTAKDGKFGRSVSHFELSYLEQPGTCRFELLVDGTHHSYLDAVGATKAVRHYSVDVPAGEHELEVVTRAGECRAFGLILERNKPGVVLDALGVQGARIRFLDEEDDDHWAAQLQLRRPDLLVFQFGANESADGFAYPIEDYHRTMKDVLLQARQALPRAGCLVVGAMDRARKEGEQLRSLPIMKHLVREQRAVASEVGCAFFDTRKAMGGEGSMAQWVRRGLGQADFTHPSGYGAEVLGNWLYRALIQSYNEYLASLRR